MIHRMMISALVLSLAGALYAAEPQAAPQVVDLKAADGTPLKASYFAGKPGPGVLLLHQCNQQRKNWTSLAEALAAAGLNVLTLDYRGYGESGGPNFREISDEERVRTVNEKFPGDVDVAFAYLLAQPGVTGVVGAGGASCGVNQAIQLARRHPQVKSLVLLSGATDREGRLFLHSAKGLPVFFSAADDDDGAVDLMQWLYSVAPNPGNEFAHYATGGHGTEMFKAHEELPRTVVEWFVTTLVTTPGKPPAAAKKAQAGEARNAKALNLLDEPGGAAQVATMLDEARKVDPKATLFPEFIANAIGYEHIQSGDTKGAVEILKLNVTAYPGSANAYDSLSDAYLANGQKDLARENAKKALERLASDTSDPEDRRKLIRDSAEGKLKQLGDKP